MRLDGASEVVRMPMVNNRTLLNVLCGIAVAASAPECFSASGHNPYEAIVQRNVFGLRPRPPPPVAPVIQAPPVDVYVAGMYEFGGKKGVLLEIVDKAPGQKKELPGPLEEGEVCGRVKVLAIQIEQGAVVVSIDGTEQRLTLEKNAPKRVAATPPRAVPLPTTRPGQRFFSRPPPSAAQPLRRITGR